MTRKQNNGRGNNGRAGGRGGPRNTKNGGRQINHSGFNDQNWDQWTHSSQGHGGRSNRGGGGGGCGRITKFPKFADVDNRNRGHNDWGRENGYGSGRNWVHNNHYNDVNDVEFGGTSNLYDHTEERNEHNQLYATQTECQDGTGGNNQQANHFDMENKIQNSSLAESAPMQLLNNDSQNTNVKSTLPSGNCTNATSVQQEIPAVEKPKLLINIKQEKHEVKLKKERKSPTPSSSSSSDTSSGEDEESEKLKTNSSSVTVTTTKVNSVASPLAIKIKPPTAAASTSTHASSSTTSLSITLPKKPPAATTSSSSSSSSSESEEEEQQPPPPTPPKKEIKKKKNVKVGDGDVVCLGLLENKIVLEDDDEDNSSDKTLKKSPKSPRKAKKSDKKTLNKCMICDKKGHTSFQCQMICKNCSAPYHGFRTCPHPANLNTMLQTFMEFSMQQLQNFQPDKQFTDWFSANQATATSETVASQSSRAISKAKKRKLQLKAKDTGRNLASTKKRKVSTKKKQANSDEDDSDTTTQSEESSSVSEDDTSSEGFESLNTSKNKKSKAKSKSYTAMPGFNMPSFMPNTSINYPLGLNGISNMTAAATNPQLNSLLLTQMFQNAIGSLANQKRS